MIFDPFPPNSRETFFKFDLEACSMTLRPTGVDPVKATLSIFGCEDKALPTVGPYLVLFSNGQVAGKWHIPSDDIDDSRGDTSFFEELGHVHGG
jgi:hypothetical protein